MSETTAHAPDTEREEGESTSVTSSADGVSAEQSKDEHQPQHEAPVNNEALVREGDVAGDYLERLLDVLDFDGDIDLDVEAGRAIVSIDGGPDLDRLVGSEGGVLEALQELARLAVQQETGVRSRLMLDIAGWRAGRKDELRVLGRTTAESVLSSGERVQLDPMSPFERKVVHDAVAAIDGVVSESEGEDPKRRVVVLPAT